MAPPRGTIPPNKQTDRNRVIVEALRAGIPPADVARVNAISRQRVTQIWQQYGPGNNLLELRRAQKRVMENGSRGHGKVRSLHVPDAERDVSR